MARRVGLEVGVSGKFGGGAASAQRRDSFRLLLVADFSGSGVGREPSIRSALRAPVRVDAAHLEQALSTLQPTVSVPGWSGGEEPLSLSSLDDLHPDHLFERLDAFANARQLRRALTASDAGPEVFASARQWLHEQGAPAAEPARAESPQADAREAGATTLERLLGGQARAGASSEGPLQALLEHAVGKQARPDVSAEKSSLLAELDQLIGAAMRRILAAPGYRALESTWRSAERVIRALDSDEELEILLFDATKAQLEVALKEAAGALESSRLHALLVDGDQRWTLVACDFGFGADADELSLLAALAATVARAGGVLLADAKPSLFGAPSLTAAQTPRAWSDAPAPPLWQALRASPLAARVGLAFPRVLLRRAYGKKSEPTESFAFEELERGAGSSDEAYLWGSAAFAVAELVGQRFREGGWHAGDGPLELEDLPLELRERDGERELLACSQVELSEQGVHAFLARGVMPLLSRRDRAALRLPSLIDVGEPSAPLRLQAPSSNGANGDGANGD